MPQPDPSPEEALKRLDERIDAVEAARAQAAGETQRGFAQGYRFLGEVVGGVLGGVGFGWLVDRFAGTSPLGLIIGLVGGAGLSIFVAVRTAAKAQAQELAKAGQGPSVPDDEDED
jgi:ATP synthase protein I